MQPHPIHSPFGVFYQYKNDKITFGFTTRGINKNSLKDYFKITSIKELNQAHSDKIHLTSTIDQNLNGDGFILDETNTLAIIKTADCVPLFFFSRDLTTAGILHIGWQGAALNIEENLILLLQAKMGLNPSDLLFYIGPCICSKCYEVGGELKNQFKNQDLIDQIFNKKKQSFKYLLDLKKKIQLSLIKRGVSEQNIQDSDLCTYTNKHFYSYRRDRGIKGRIYNFMIRY